VTKRKEVTPDVITDIEIIPTVVGQGRYRLYKKPDGTMRVQFREDSADEDAFFEFPAALLVLAKNAAERLSSWEVSGHSEYLCNPWISRAGYWGT